MTVAVTDGADAVSVNVHTIPVHIPQLAGYTTGSGFVPWTASQWAQHKGALRICQNPGATDYTADILDVESGAATLTDCPIWAVHALASFHAATRPGQRKPAIYCSASNVTSVVNALIAGGVHSGVGLFVADWTNSRAAALAKLETSGGPFPVTGVQYQDAGTYDLDLFLTSWLAEVSGKAVVPQVPPGQWLNPAAWTWKAVTLAGTGLDGKQHVFTFSPETGVWTT